LLALAFAALIGVVIIVAHQLLRNGDCRRNRYAGRDARRDLLRR
jgi:hypothetical protein